MLNLRPHIAQQLHISLGKQVCVLSVKRASQLLNGLGVTDVLCLLLIREEGVGEKQKFKQFAVGFKERCKRMNKRSSMLSLAIKTFFCIDGRRNFSQFGALDCI